MSIVELTRPVRRFDNETSMRIQVLVEDYSEMIGLSTTLKKVGFDVDSTQNPLGLADSLLGFNPDLLIMTAHGRRVLGLDLARQLKRNRGLPRVLLLHEVSRAPETDPDVEAWVKSPIDFDVLITTIARVCTLNEASLLEKLRATMAASAPPPGSSITLSSSGQGRLDASTLGDAERRERYKKFLNEPKPATHGLAAAKVRDQVKALRKDEVAQSAEAEDLEKERREFVTQLFKR